MGDKYWLKEGEAGNEGGSCLGALFGLCVREVRYDRLLSMGARCLTRIPTASKAPSRR